MLGWSHLTLGLSMEAPRASILPAAPAARPVLHGDRKGGCLWGGGHDLNASFQFEHVFGCVGCMGTQSYTGCSELRYR